jgi:sugar lactone lactonase YvrE
LGLAALFVLSGCSAGTRFVSATTGTQSAATTTLAGGSLQGTVHGGQSPVSGATIQLWAFGSGGYGATSGPLISGSALTTPGVALTDANGNFNITGQYTCSPSTQVYITSTGGNPGLTAGTNNSALVLMSALVNCGSLPGLTGPIVINEVTTVGSVYALAQFIGAGGSGGNIGAPNTGGGGAQTGLSNAFNEVTNMINIYTGTANTQTEFGTGYVPQAEIDTLANILVPCVNTSGPGSAACGSLFAAATPSGGTLPTTVLGAALDIALNPGNNVSGLFGLANANAAFQPTLTVAPNDWTVALAYDLSNHPQGLAIDGSGDVWITAWVSNNPANSEVFAMSPIGIPASNSPYTSTTNLAGSAGIAVDLNGDVWIANSTGNSAVALILSSNTIELKYGPYPAAAELNAPLQVVVDGTIAGNVWFTNSGNNTLSEIIPNPTFATATYNFYSGGGLSTPNGIAFYTIPFGASSVWVANQGADSVTEFAPASGGATSGNNYTVGGVINPVGAAVDGSGDIWVTNPSTNSVTELNSSGAAVSTNGWTGGGLDGPSGIALDGAGNLWVANTTNSSVTELKGSTGAALTPSTGYQSASLQSPSQIAIDASGNIWAINTNEVTSLHGHETVTEFLGLATPVNMPLVYSLASHEIGQTPH